MQFGCSLSRLIYINSMHMYVYRWLYWTDWGQVAKIERISMDGNDSSRQILHNTGLAWPNCLTIDYSTETLYWADAQLNKIETSKVDGTNRRILTTNLILHPFGLTYHSGYLYWSDWQTDQITMTPVSSPDNVTVVVSTLDTEPMGIEVVALSRQPICECSSVVVGYIVAVVLPTCRQVYMHNTQWSSDMTTIEC